MISTTPLRFSLPPPRYNHNTLPNISGFAVCIRHLKLPAVPRKMTETLLMTCRAKGAESLLSLLFWGGGGVPATQPCSQTLKCGILSPHTEPCPNGPPVWSAPQPQPKCSFFGGWAALLYTSQPQSPRNRTFPLSVKRYKRTLCVQRPR